MEGLTIYKTNFCFFSVLFKKKGLWDVEIEGLTMYKTNFCFFNVLFIKKRDSNS